MSCFSANSSSRSPRSFLSSYPNLPMILSHPLLSLPIFAFQSFAMIPISFFGVFSALFPSVRRIVSPVRLYRLTWVHIPKRQTCLTAVPGILQP